MAGSSPIVPSITAVRRLLAAARSAGGPYGTVLEVSILALCLPWEAVAIDLEKIEWATGFVEIPARGGRNRILVLPGDARATILRVAGSASGKGQAVTAGRGKRLEARYVRLDRLQDYLADTVSDAIEIEGWNFHGIRVAGERALSAAGRSPAETATALGRYDRGVQPPRVRAEIAAMALETWCSILRDTTRQRGRGAS